MSGRHAAPVGWGRRLVWGILSFTVVDVGLSVWLAVA